MRYLCLICYACYHIKYRGKHSPCNRSDLRNFARIQKRVCGTAEGSPDIEGDDEFSREARVTGACCIHDGSEQATDRVCNPSGTLSTPLGPTTLFLHMTEMKDRHTEAGHTSRPIPSGTRKPHLISHYKQGKRTQPPTKNESYAPNLPSR